MPMGRAVEDSYPTHVRLVRESNIVLFVFGEFGVSYYDIPGKADIVKVVPSGILRLKFI